MAKDGMIGVTSITRNGTDYWYARVDGDRKYCGKGQKGHKLAVAERSKCVAKRYENREMNAGLKVKKVQFKTVTDLSNWYMQLPKVQGQKSYQRKVNASSHVLAYFGRTPVYRIESDDIERYRLRRTTSGAAEGTVNIEVILLSAMYTEARKAKKVHADMVPGEFHTVDSRNPRPIILDDVFETLLRHAKLDFADFLVCGYESAMRSSEICDLRAYQVHLDEKRISGGRVMVVDYIDIGIFDTKTKARRTVPVSPGLKEVLQRRLEGLEPEDRVFTKKDGSAWNPKTVCMRFKYACNRAGIPHGDKLLNEKGERVGVVFHCLRHTRTTKWVQMGFSDEIIRRATGHKTLEAYQNYVKLGPTAVMSLVSEKRYTNGIKLSQRQ
jgi:integrase